MMRRVAALNGFARGVASIVRSVLQEIFDESAYTRFLLRRRLQTSRESYAEFLREDETIRQQRPRCC
jgi:hypothetical protein